METKSIKQPDTTIYTSNHIVHIFCIKIWKKMPDMLISIVQQLIQEKLYNRQELIDYTYDQMSRYKSHYKQIESRCEYDKISQVWQVRRRRVRG